MNVLTVISFGPFGLTNRGRIGLDTARISDSRKVDYVYCRLRPTLTSRFRGPKGYRQSKRQRVRHQTRTGGSFSASGLPATTVGDVEALAQVGGWSSLEMRTIHDLDMVRFTGGHRQTLCSLPHLTISSRCD